MRMRSLLIDIAGVALLGTALAAEQLKLLGRYCDAGGLWRWQRCLCRR